MTNIELANELIAKGVEILEECGVLVESEGIKRVGRVRGEKELSRLSDKELLELTGEDRNKIKNDLKSGKKIATLIVDGAPALTGDKKMANMINKLDGRTKTDFENWKNSFYKNVDLHKKINERAAKNESVDLINEAIELLGMEE